eukprot:scaffold53_cov193-Pinguiococcus_pyrenoidosus.AAC.21
MSCPSVTEVEKVKMLFPCFSPRGLRGRWTDCGGSVRSDGDWKHGAASEEAKWGLPEVSADIGPAWGLRGRGVRVGLSTVWRHFLLDSHGEVQPLRYAGGMQTLALRLRGTTCSGRGELSPNYGCALLMYPQNPWQQKPGEKDREREREGGREHLAMSTAIKETQLPQPRYVSRWIASCATIRCSSSAGRIAVAPRSCGRSCASIPTSRASGIAWERT